MNLSTVSKTAIGTLVSRAIASENNLINDSMAVTCLTNLLSKASEEEKKQILKIKTRQSGKLSTEVKIFAQRTAYFDKIVNDFIATHPSSSVINLGCGFDTRFWRINNKSCTYIDLDLPEVITLKQELLKEHIGYEQLAYSVLDLSWIDKVTSNGNSNFLLIADGLLVYFPKEDIRRLFGAISKRFTHSQITLNVVPVKYTRGFWKFIIKWSLKRVMGLNLSYVFGVKKPEDIEHYAAGIKIIDYVTIQNIWFINAGINHN